MRFERKTRRMLSAITIGAASVMLIAPPLPLYAQTREEVVLWESIKDSEHVSDFQGYLDKYPSGTFATVAKRRIEELSKKSDESNTVHVPLTHGNAGFFEVSRPGTLTISPNGVSWEEQGGRGDSFQAHCEDVTFHWQGGDVGRYFELRVNSRKYLFYWDDPANRDTVVDALRHTCGLSI